MRSGVLLCLSLDILRIGLFEEGSQLSAEFGKMIKQLGVSKFIRTGNARMLIDCDDPRLENALTMGKDIVPKGCDYWDRSSFCAVVGNGVRLLTFFRR